MLLKNSISQTMLNNLTTAVILLDDSMRVLYANNAAEQALSTSGSRLAGENVCELFAEDAMDPGELYDSLKAQQPFTRRQVKLQLNHGPDLTVDYTVTPVPGKRKVLLIEIFPCDRWLRISRETLIHSQQESTRLLIKGFAHEIKNPLGGIRGAAQLLAEELPDPQLTDYTRVIIEEADRLRNLVDKMLGPNQFEPLEKVNIHEVLERVRSLIDSECGGNLTVERDYDPSIPEIEGSFELLIQACLNIARNAMRALQQQENPKEPPCLTLRTRALRQMTLGQTRHRVICLVSIEDNGPGIPKEIQETIFYPMVSSPGNGSGIGLTIAQNLVDRHEGLIEFNSEPGHTCFNIFLPLVQTEQSQLKQQREKR